MLYFIIQCDTKNLTCTRKGVRRQTTKKLTINDKNNMFVLCEIKIIEYDE